MHHAALRIFVVAIFAVSLSFVAVPLQARATIVSKQNISYPFTTSHVTCTGDLVVLTGELHYVLTLLFDDSGQVHISVRNTSQEVSGFGTVSGDRYRGVLVNGGTSSSGTSTSITYLRIIGQGPDNDFYLRVLTHSTVTPNGDVVALFEHFTADPCK